MNYTVELARVFRFSSPGAAFSFLSGSGADPTGRSRISFARYRGAAEKALLAEGFPRVYIFRTAYIYPVDPRKEPNLSCPLMRAIYPAFRMPFPNQAIRADDLAPAMVDVAVRRTENRQSPVFESRDIRGVLESRHTAVGDHAVGKWISETRGSTGLAVGAVSIGSIEVSPLAFAGDAVRAMGIQSSFAWQALPEACFCQKGRC